MLMKRLTTLLFTILFSFGLLFAQEDSVNDDSFVIAPTLSFSVFGPEFGAIIGRNHMELALSLALAGGDQSPSYFLADGYNDGEDLHDTAMAVITPKIHLGYNFEAFDTGWTDTIGLAYASAIGFFGKNTVENMEALALYFRGGVRTKAGFAVGVTSYLPFVYFIAGPDRFFIRTIGNTDGFWECLGAGFICSSLNFQWYF